MHAVNLLHSGFTRSAYCLYFAAKDRPIEHYFALLICTVSSLDLRYFTSWCVYSFEGHDAIFNDYFVQIFGSIFRRNNFDKKSKIMLMKRARA